MTKHEAIEWLNAIKEKYIRGGDDYYDRQRRFAIDWAILLLKKDTVPVVRCKDCKHTREKNGHEQFMYNENVCICTKEDIWGITKNEPVLDDDFCPYGERKDNGI